MQDFARQYRQLQAVSGPSLAQVTEEMRRNMRLSGVPIAEAARRMGLVPAGMSDEEFRVLARERFERDWRDCRRRYQALRFPRLRWMLRRIWPV